MINYILFFLFSPVIEYCIHKSLHIIGNHYHRDHHIQITKKENDRELWIFFFLFPAIYYEKYYICIGLTRYYIGHYIIHNFGHLYPSLTAHHMEHHRNPKINFCVTGIYPDTIKNFLVRLTLKKKIDFPKIIKVK